jgi:hypothetical protein
MPQIVLNQPRICTLVGQGEAAGMAQHVRMGCDGQTCQAAIVASLPFPQRSLPYDIALQSDHFFSSLGSRLDVA